MRVELRKIRKIIDRAKRRYQEDSRQKIKVAFVGCGKHATENLYPALRYASMDLVTVCAEHLENAERCALSFGAESAYDDYREMLDKERIDALIVCVNPKLHYEISQEALKRGMPVFVEKPPALSSKEANEMLELSNKADKFLMVGFNKRFAPVYKEAKRIIDSDAFGKLNSIFISSNVGATKDKESLLFEVGIHYIDLFRYLSGEIRNFHVDKKIDKDKATFIISCTFENQAIGALQLSNAYSWSKPGEHIEIVGEESLLILNNAHKIIYHKATIVPPGEIPQEPERSTVWLPNYSIPVKENHLIYLNGYVPELIYFADMVSRSQKGYSNIEDGLMALRIIENILGK